MEGISRATPYPKGRAAVAVPEMTGVRERGQGSKLKLKHTYFTFTTLAFKYLT